MKNKSRTKLWLVVLPAMTVPFISSLFYFVLFSEHIFARYLYGATKLFTLLWPITVATLVLKEPGPCFSLYDKLHWKALPWGVLSGAAVVVLMFALMETEIGGVMAASTPQIREKAVALGILNYYWSFALFLSIIHSLIEEYYWRWFVYGTLRRLLASPAAHLIAGLSFAAHHVVVASEFFSLPWGIVLGTLVGAGGIIWSLLYQKQGTLSGAWVSHILVDLGIMGVGWKLLA
ncbi:MAG TPA: type II CAAX endopeptidase family protein [Oligoflexia bacterium]|nr:type II CAAX endopeptidase family protein [Oligoflexia bacterium]